MVVKSLCTGRITPINASLVYNCTENDEQIAIASAGPSVRVTAMNSCTRDLNFILYGTQNLVTSRSTRAIESLASCQKIRNNVTSANSGSGLVELRESYQHFQININLPVLMVFKQILEFGHGFGPGDSNRLASL